MEPWKSWFDITSEAKEGEKSKAKEGEVECRSREEDIMETEPVMKKTPADEEEAVRE